MSISNPTPQVQYSEEMDWSPSQPQHRAFRDSAGSKANRPFGQSPTQPDGNPFWYKVPAAPTNPAHRLRNPPNQPILRKKPAEKTDLFFTTRDAAETEPDSKRRTSGQNGNIAFKNPSFFAPEQHDEANSLADMLGQSFSLSQEDNEVTERATPAKNSMWKSQAASSTAPVNKSMDLYALLVVFPFWLLVTSMSVPYRMEMQGVMLVVAGIIALGGTGGSESTASMQSLSLSDVLFSALGVLELAAVCWIGWETWTGKVDVCGYGTGVLGVMLAHQTWKSFNA